MIVDFIKMQGLGNDFLVFNCLSSELLADTIVSVATSLCDRRFGIGADQILLLLDPKVRRRTPVNVRRRTPVNVRRRTPEDSDFQMRIINADGSEVEMCGNGIRCLAKYIWEAGLSQKDTLDIETLAGTIRPQRVGKLVKVDMGQPVLEGSLIPTMLTGKVVDHPLKINGKTFNITCVSMGNPHTVIFVDDVEGFPVHEYGSIIEKHPFFPKRTNVEFVEIIDSTHIKMRVWERGANETLACGTGACAASVASTIKGFTTGDTNVLLRGGELLIQWQNGSSVYMTGPSVSVFNGSIDLDRFLGQE